MPRTPRFPPYPARPHSSGQARIKIYGQVYYLGVHGTPASWAEYNRLLVEWRGGRLVKVASHSPPSQSPLCHTVTGLVAAWWCWAERSQRTPDGEIRKAVLNARFGHEPLVRIFGDTLVLDFDAASLLRLQEAMATGTWLSPDEVAFRTARGIPLGWCRSHANRCTSRVKSLFRWGELRGLVPAGHSAKLSVVPGLTTGEHGVRETDEVPPVDPVVVAMTLPHLRPVVRAVVELLALTGARPSELLGIRPIDVNKTGVIELARGYRVELGSSVWALQPKFHKTAGKGLRRVILFGPKAQLVLAPFLERPADAYCFSPAEEVAAWRAEQRRTRQTPVQPSQANRRTAAPTRPPSTRYNAGALATAIKRAIDRVVGPVPGFGQCPHWTPYSLRHLAATRLAEDFGVEIAMTILGHRHLKTLAIYALPSLQKAADAMRDVG